MEEQYEIPKIIHFVWAGGDKLLTEDGMNNVANWAKANPGDQTDSENLGFHIRLWVDSQTCNKSFEEMLEAYRKQFKSLGVDVIRQEKLGNYSGKVTPIVICDLDKELRHDIVMHEMDQLCPNYGASSDLIRYLVLYKYGGAYFDSTDVLCNKNQSLVESGIFKYWDRHVLYLDHLSQVQNPSVEALQEFNLEKEQQQKNRTGNDTLVSTRKNPLALKFYSQSLKNYTVLNAPQLSYSHIAAAHASMQDLTVFRTGPICVRNAILDCNPVKEQDYYKVVVDEKAVTIRRVRDGKDLEKGGLCLTQPINNTRNWLNARILDCSQTVEMRKLAQAKIMKSIGFECSNFKILRLDNHIDVLSKSLKIARPAAAEYIIEQIKSQGLLKRPISFIQINFSNPETIKFFQEVRGLWGPGRCASILNIDVNNLGKVVMMETSFQSLLNNLEIINVLAERKQCSVVNALAGEGNEKVNILEQQVESALAYIENLIEYVDLLPEQNVLPLLGMLMGPSPDEEVQDAQEAQIGVLGVLNEFCLLIRDVKQGETTLDPQRVQAIADRIGEIAPKYIEDIDQTPLYEQAADHDTGIQTPGAEGNIK